MKKYISSLLIVLSLLGCSVTPSSSASSAEPEPTPDVLADDEIRAGSVILKTKELDMGGYRWLDDPEPAFVQISMTEAFRLFDEGGTALMLFSYDTCPYCNRAVPVLNKALKESGATCIYVDIYEEEIRALSKDEFTAMLDVLTFYLDSALDHETNPETGKLEPVMYVPLAVAVIDGQPVDHHTSLVDGSSVATDEDQLTDEQKQELQSYYERLIKRLQ